MKHRFALICFVTLLLVVGCKKNAKDKWDDFDAMIQSEETKSPVTDVDANTEYVGSSIELPENVLNNSETVISITSGEDSPLELYSLESNAQADDDGSSSKDDGPYNKYVLLDDGGWESRECPINKQINALLEADSSYESLSLNYIKRGKDGSLYAMGNATYASEEEDDGEDEGGDLGRFFGNSLIFSLGLEGEELNELTFDLPEGNTGRRESWIVDFDVFANGELFVQYNGVAAVVDPSTGETIHTYDTETTTSGMNLGENEVFTVEIMNGKFNIIEAVSGEAISTINHVVHDRESYPSWRAVSNEKGVYLADISGIYKADSFTSGEFHQLVSSANNNELTNLYMITLLVDDNEDVYGVFFDVSNRMNRSNRTPAEAESLNVGYQIMKYSSND